jgi:hypothetical protein
MQRLARVSLCCVLPMCVHSQAAKKDTKTTTAATKAGPSAPAPPTAKAIFFDYIVVVFRSIQASGLAGAKRAV